MTERNEAIIALIRAKTKELIEAGPQACRDYLISLEIYNQDGTLTKEYGGE